MIGHALPHRGDRRRPATDDARALVEGGGGHDERALRRAVGPTAWAVLADLWLDARDDDDGVLVVAASARRAAVNVGIGKDAAARALRRLIGAGVLCRRPQGNDAAGRFVQSTYELHLAHPAPGPPRPADPDTVDHPCTGPADTEGDDPAPVSASSGTGNRRRSPSGESRRASRTLPSQLSLLDVGIGGGGGPAGAMS